MSNIHCAVSNCTITLYNKPPGVVFYSCPTSSEMRNRWLLLLKNKCSVLDWARSKICSKHFEIKYIDSQRKLKDHAIPTLFPQIVHKMAKPQQYSSKSKVDRLINQKSQAELTLDIENNISRLRDPSNTDMYINDNLKCRADAPGEVQLWLLIKKQASLITRLTEQVSQHRKHVSVLQKNLEESRLSKKDTDQKIESLKYIVKCLQEKHATLEEQIEILTAVESG